MASVLEHALQTAVELINAKIERVKLGPDYITTIDEKVEAYTLQRDALQKLHDLLYVDTI